MADMDVQDRIKAVKVKMEKLIQDGHLAEAKSALDQYNAKMPGDPDICSMRAVLAIMEGSLNEAEAFIEEGLKRDSVQFDLLYNLAYIRELQGLNQEAADLYKKAGTVAVSEEQISNMNNSLEKLESEYVDISVKDKPKIVFFVKESMDSFLGDIIVGLSDIYWVRKIIVSDYGQIDAGMEWANICWFEWCDELVAYGSRLPISSYKKIICRLHRYEAFSDHINNVVWENIDKVIFVSDHIKSTVVKKVNLPESKCIVVLNGINNVKFDCQKRSRGYNLAWIGYLNLRKNPVLVLQYLYELVKKDNRYKLHIAGSFQDEPLQQYMEDIIDRLGLNDNVIQYGYMPNDRMNEWLKDKNYIVTGSIAEGHPVGVMEAMSCGLKPVIHYFPGAEEFYPHDYIYYNLEDFLKIITEPDYDPEEYHNYINSKFSLVGQLNKIKCLIKELITKKTIVEEATEFLSQLNSNRVIIEDLSVFFPSYNRAEIIRNDFFKGYKMPGQPKIIVDDFSDTINRDILYKLKAESNDIENIIFHDKNMGVAAGISTGIKNANSKFILTCGDDDILFWRTKSYINEEVKKIGEEYAFIIPRFVLNLGEDGDLRIGYDRFNFSKMSALEILRHLFLSGELSVMIAGMIAKRDDLHRSLPDNVFRVSEDYVTIARLLSLYPQLPVHIIDALVYIRRISNTTLSRRMDNTKLSIHLLSLIVSGYYCFKNEIINKNQLIDSIKKRAQLLKSIYNYNTEFADIITKYISEKINVSEFINYTNSIGITMDFDSLPEEIKNITKL